MLHVVVPDRILMHEIVAAQTMMNIKDRLPKGTAPWYDGPSL